MWHSKKREIYISTLVENNKITDAWHVFLSTCLTPFVDFDRKMVLQRYCTLRCLRRRHLKSRKKNKMYQVQHKSVHCSSQSPGSSTKYKRIRKRKGYLFMTNKKQQLYLQINWDNTKALIDQKPIIYSKENFFKKASIRFLSKYCVGYYPVNR